MSETRESPIIAANSPVEVELEAGKTYYWCRCGRSKNQPFCDGSHKGTGFSPEKFVAESSGGEWLCRCKHTKNPPFCDGSHNQFADDLVGQAGPGVSKGGDGAPEPENSAEEPYVEFIHELARNGLSKVGHHGPMTAMGVPRSQLPTWDQIQIMTAQLASRPLPESADVATKLVIGPRAAKPLELNIPLFVSDMSFGALSEEAKVALARGAELVGTGICSGEGGMLPEEQAENSRYFYELASAKFGWTESLLDKVQAFHFKGGQGAKTGTGGHLPGNKNVGKISQVRGIPEGEPAISPPVFEDLVTVDDFRRFADRVRELTGGIPIGFKLSANHIERDMRFAIDASADYIILDGRGGATGAAPALFRDHISVPTIPALARARRFLDQEGLSGEITLIVTGGLRTPADFVKALSLGADGIAVANAAIQAIGCVGARICNTNNCPSGVATQNAKLRQRIDIQVAAGRLGRFFDAVTELMKVMARACGHDDLAGFCLDDIATWHWDLARLAGVPFAGVGPLDR